MAASEPTSTPPPPSAGASEWLGAAELNERLEEEIGRAERYGTPLSLLLVVVENLEEIAREHGGELREQTLAYIAGALNRELRRFDRIAIPGQRELAILLPGADGPHGEMVARRVLDRLRAIKVEAAQRREGLRISVGLASWRPEGTAESILGRARLAAARAANGEPSPLPEEPPEAAGLAEPPLAPS
jgi:diguanylate cyclase (GGDEF)-like protein